MRLLASYFPHSMSLDNESGKWHFYNRNGYPVGVNLVEGDEHWGRLADRYPLHPVRLASLDKEALRALCAPEWRNDDDEPLDEGQILFYGPTSYPGASAKDMEAYLKKLEFLIRAGAHRSLFPYGMEFQKDGSWVFIDRNYKPIGMNIGYLPWIKYLAWPVGVVLPSLNEEILTSLSYSGSYDHRCEVPGGTQIHFYDDASSPTNSQRNMDTYLQKLQTIMLMHGPTNSKLPPSALIRKWVRKAQQKAGGFAILRTILKVLLIVRPGV